MDRARACTPPHAPPAAAERRRRRGAARRLLRHAYQVRVDDADATVARRLGCGILLRRVDERTVRFSRRDHGIRSDGRADARACVRHDAAARFGMHEYGAATRAIEPPTLRADLELPRPPRLQHAPLRDGDDALPQVPRRQRLRARPRHDPARLVHDEAQRGHRDGGRHLAGVRAASTRSHRQTTSQGYLELIGQLESLARRGHRLRRGLAAAERRHPGRAGGAARDPRLPPRERRRPAPGLPHPVERARHQRGVGRARGDEGRRRRLRRARQCRSRRPAGEDRRRTPTSSPR